MRTKIVIASLLIALEVALYRAATSINRIDWRKMGAALREAALDAHGNEHLPLVNFSYSFLLENPECFGWDNWPAGMPDEPPTALVEAYYA